MSETGRPRDVLEAEVHRLRRRVADLESETGDVSGRTAAEAALRDKTEELDRYFSYAREMLCVADMDGHFRRLNREWETVLGYPVSELEGALFLDYVHPDDVDQTVRAIARLGAQEEVLDFVNRYRARDGSYRWLEWRSFPAGSVIYAVARDITERRNADDVVRENLARLQTMVRAAHIVIYEIDRLGVVTMAEGGGLAGTGLSTADVVGRPVSEIYSEDTAIQESFRRVLAGESFTTTVVVGTRVYDASAEPMFGADGEYDGTLGVLVDVTERVHAEAKLARVNRQLRLLSDCNQALIRATDEAGLLETVCRIVVDVGGYRMAWVGFADDDEGRTVRPVAHAGLEDGYLDGARVTWDESDRGRGPVGTAIRTRQACPVQDIAADASFTPWRAEAARRGYAAVCGLPLVAGDRVLGALGVYAAEPDAFDPGEVARLSEMAGDLAFGIMTLRTRAERERAEETLRASDERFRRLILNSNDIIAVTDERAIQVSVSGSVERTLGYRPEELLGVSGFDLIHPDDVAIARQAFAECASVPGAVRRLEYRYRHRDGHWVWLEAVGTNLLDDAVVRGVVMNIRDISERKNAEEERDALQNQLQQAMKMEAVGRLAGGIAHDFNNLLTAIAGNVELARMELTAADPLVHYLDEVGSAAASAAALTRRLLAFARRQIIEPRVLDLNDLVDGLRKMLGRLIGEDVELRFVPGPELGAVRVDPGQFEQVLVNLAVNARDAMPDGGSLVIETANVDLDEEYCARHPNVVPGPFVMLAVSDTGHGMSEAVKQRLFEPFFTTKPQGRGTGLGLAIIFGAVRQAKGTIDVQSEVGKGTTFRIYLPRESHPPSGS